jgi:hypothetical protein
MRVLTLRFSQDLLVLVLGLYGYRTALQEALVHARDLEDSATPRVLDSPQTKTPAKAHPSATQSAIQLL